MSKVKVNPLTGALHSLGDKLSPIHSFCECFLEKTLVPVFNYIFKRVKWENTLIFLFLHFACGCVICSFSNYSISVYVLVSLSLGSITFISVLAEKEFIERSNLVQKGILGHSASYNHNTEIAAMMANARKRWNISGGGYS